MSVLENLHDQASQVYKEMWLFMGRASHQIKTPVTAMQATLDVLLRKERTKEELLSGLVDIQSAASHLNGLTRKLITSSRISFQENPLKEPVDLKVFFEGLLDFFKSNAAERGVSLILENSQQVQVMSNRALLADVCGNLIENAILYSPHKVNSSVRIKWH